MQQIKTARSKIRTSKSKKSIVKSSALYVMMLPGLIYLFVNNYIPMAGLLIAFKNVNFTKGIFRSDWIGFKNFEFLFKSADAFIITRNTILYNVSFIIINTVVAVAVAILLNEIKNKVFLSLYQSLILLPYLISMVVVSYLVFAMLSTDTGFLNKTILPALGLKEIMWYTESKVWPIILTLVHNWKGFGFLSVIYFSSVVGISEEYYEAASLDGATKWQQIKLITIPLIRPTIIIMTMLAIGRIFYSDFGLFYQVPMNSGAVYSTTDVIDTYVFRGLLQLGNIGMSSAAGMYQSVVGFILILLSNYAVKKFSTDDALF
ncbi:MAG: binding-protein-dependent transport system inner rane component [Clostridiales bacterium]|jgi:putative aldouronate transport system permease protein|nr:binding-protein-dependent transport system inner rane component [Clostridiales bacterium]